MTEQIQSVTLKDGGMLTLPCEKLADHPLRLEFYSQMHLEELASSIRETGLLEPILVWEQQEGKYIILSGHYRIRAVRRLRKKNILCRVFKCDRHAAYVVYCTSNLMTRGLSAIEEAHILSGLISKEGYTMEQAGKLWGHGKSWVCRRLKLLTVLNPKLKNELGKGSLSPRLAQELTRLPQGNEQERVLSIVRRHYLNKDDTSAFIDWWLTAGEDERKKAEEEDNFPGILKPHKKNGYVKIRDTDPGIYVACLLKRCTILIEEITDFLSDKEKPFAWWPQLEYRSFCRSSDEFSCLFRGGNKLTTSKEALHNASSL